MNNYKTVKKGAYDEFVDKKSRFIGYVKPVVNEDEAIEFINAVRKKHYDATHNCYAYIVRDNNIMRYSDDGEPAGTAGMPILDVLRKEELTDVCVVVTRYFGGTLLGTGGLVRAYTKGAQVGLDAAERIEKLFCNIYSVKCDYSAMGSLQYAIVEDGEYILKDTIFTDNVEFIVYVKKPDATRFEKMIENKTAGSIKPVITATEYIDNPLKKD
ncbi:MAG: YigZ family protein [Clostridia bacterium]|nr:YigZ family protein [Clostridia bacterium]